jgi:integrase
VSSHSRRAPYKRAISNLPVAYRRVLAAADSIPQRLALDIGAFGRSRAHPHADSRMSRLVIAAELLGHARLETTRAYTRPTAEDRSKAIDLLPVDE